MDADHAYFSQLTDLCLYLSQPTDELPHSQRKHQVLLAAAFIAAQSAGKLKGYEQLDPELAVRINQERADLNEIPGADWKAGGEVAVYIKRYLRGEITAETVLTSVKQFA